MGNRELAESLTQKISEKYSTYFGKKLSKPIQLSLKENEPEERRKWPTGWNPTIPEHFVLGMHAEFDLEKTWWSLKGVDRELLSKASLEQKYLLVLSHEIAHIYMYPTPLIAWFQEAIAMNIGRELAIKIDPSMKDFFPTQFEAVSPEELQDYHYEVISKDMDALKKLQYSAMGLAKKYSREDLLGWVKSNSPEGYNPLKDGRSHEEVERSLIETMPNSTRK